MRKAVLDDLFCVGPTPVPTVMPTSAPLPLGSTWRVSKRFAVFHITLSLNCDAANLWPTASCSKLSWKILRCVGGVCFIWLSSILGVLCCKGKARLKRLCQSRRSVSVGHLIGKGALRNEGGVVVSLQATPRHAFTNYVGFIRASLHVRVGFSLESCVVHKLYVIARACLHRGALDRVAARLVFRRMRGGLGRAPGCRCPRKTKGIPSRMQQCAQTFLVLQLSPLINAQK